MRYETGVPIGSGGMGTVVRSFDPVLKRPVALKILSRDEPELAERMLYEARAQAAVDHPNVAQVYEVGHLEDGRPFIAMQLIEGPPLDEAVKDLPLDQRIQILATVADAVHAAHATGLVHRDLKPSNILVERSSEAGLKPYVLDFGIAREESVPGITVTGQVLGTPGYMAPEQASGQVHTLDRRADIFSLGVMLYELIAGAPPFRGESSVEKLVSLLSDDPEPLRRRVPTTPPDLEAITFMCLEKDPARRYPSARELADDLRRYLAGEPVRARRVTWLGRTVRLARKHSLVTALLSMAAVAVLAAGLLAIASQVGARRQAHLAQQLGQRTERINSIMRLARLLPHHELTQEIMEVRNELHGIRELIRGRSGTARAIGHHALGRGHLGIWEYEQAREELTRAWMLNLRTPEVAAALARAHAELFHARMEQSRQHRDAEVREALAEQAARELKEPAMHYFEHAQALGGSGVLDVEALLALSEGSFEKALECVDRLAEEGRASVENQALADTLTGQVFLQQAYARFWASDYKGQGESLDRAATALERAVEVGRSDPIAHHALCQVWVARLEMESEVGAHTHELLTSAERSCGAAIRLVPQDPRPLLTLGRALGTRAQFLSRRGKEPAKLVERMLALADSVVAIDSGNVDARILKGRAFLILGDWVSYSKADPEPHLREAIAALEEASHLAPDLHEVYNLLGNAFSSLADMEQERGGDPVPIALRSLVSYEQVMGLPGGSTRRVLSNYGATVANLAFALLRQGQDPTPWLDRGESALTKALEWAPGYVSARISLGLCLWTRALAETWMGRDPEPSFVLALGEFGRVAELDSSRTTAFINRVGVGIDYARWLLRQGRDPREVLAAARQDNDRVKEAFFWDFSYTASDVDLIEAQWLLAGRQPTETLLAQARAHAERAFRLAPDAAESHRILALCEWVTVMAYARGVLPPVTKIRRHARRGLELAERARAINPGLGAARGLRAVFLEALAESAEDDAERRRLREEAHQAALDALRVEPSLDDPEVRRLAGVIGQVAGGAGERS